MYITPLRLLYFIAGSLHLFIPFTYCTTVFSPAPARGGLLTFTVSWKVEGGKRVIEVTVREG